ncbi:MAG TPA: hypothetical protein VHC90_07130 [Bryobacteraceae bacterium]|nr:hypothetical protein [Bryobacteraceae bacterium]
MRKNVAIAGGAAITAFLTYGFVDSGTHLAGPLSPFTYQGAFRCLILSIWCLAPSTGVEEFGRFIAHFVWFICPLAGFAFYTFSRRQKLGADIWKPLAIAAATALLSLGPAEPLPQALRAVAVFTLMLIPSFSFARHRAE